MTQRQVYQANISFLEVRLAERLTFGASALISRVRQAARRYQSQYAPAQAADQWLLSNLGHCGDRFRRAAVASLALSLTPDALGVPRSVLALYPDLHGRLADFLAGLQPYDDALFARDISLSAGVTAPMGSFSVAPDGGPSSWSDIGLAAPVLRHQVLSGGASAGLGWMLRHGRRPWALMQLDTCNTRNLNPNAFQQSCQRLAALMEIRPEIPGVIGASWVFDPQLDAVNPKLAFLRLMIEAGRGEFSVVHADPAEITEALGHTPELRSASKHVYHPRAYRLIWARHDIIAWSQAKKSASTSSRARSATPRDRARAERFSDGLAQA